MKKITITTSKEYTDIDALASAIAYKELRKGERNLVVVLPGRLNESVTSEIRSWRLSFLTEFKEDSAAFVLVDVSEPDFFPDFVEQDKILEIYDHRAGFEKYWSKRLGNRAKIELVGACATLIWEEYKKRGIKRISSLAANLLYTAIASNTLNFNASVTTARDRQAFSDLKEFIDLPADWIRKYYQDQEKSIYADPRKAVINDTKIQKFPGLNIELVIGQLELWDSRKFIENHLSEAEKALISFKNVNWFLTSPSISEGKNYIYTKSKTVKDLLGRIFEIKFKGNLGVSQKLWLRKEILKKLLELRN